MVEQKAADEEVEPKPSGSTKGTAHFHLFICFVLLVSNTLDLDTLLVYTSLSYSSFDKF
jgi:hypothetical protein